MELPNRLHDKHNRPCKEGVTSEPDLVSAMRSERMPVNS
jgi:hypothetical protein